MEMFSEFITVITTQPKIDPNNHSSIQTKLKTFPWNNSKL